MKRALLTLTLLGSVAANVALLVSRFRPDSIEHVPVAAASLPPKTDASATTANPLANIDASTWTQLTAGDAANLVAQLRAKGFPPALVRAIVTAYVRESFAARRKALADELAAAPFWRGGVGGIVGEPKYRLAQRALEREIAEKVRALVGPGVSELTDLERESYERRFGPLPPDTLERLRNLVADYDDMRTQITTEMAGVLFPDDSARMALIEKERRADLARLLTPEQLEAYDLRTSRTSGTLRSRLAAFDASEDEFRALHRLYAVLDDRLNPQSGATMPQTRQAREEAEKSLAPAIAAALGPERYADYQRTTQPDWVQAHGLLTFFDLPATHTEAVVTLRRESLARSIELQKDPNLTPELRRQHLATLADDTARRLTAIVGEKGVAGFRSHDGAWFTRLKPPAKP